MNEANPLPLQEEGYIHNQEVIQKYEELVTMGETDAHELEDTLSESLDTLNRDEEVSTAILKILQFVKVEAAPYRKAGLEENHQYRKYLNTILNDKQRREVYEAGLEVDPGTYEKKWELYDKLKELNLPELEEYPTSSIKMDIATATPPLLGTHRTYNTSVLPNEQRSENKDVYYYLEGMLEEINDAYIELAGVIPVQENTKERYGENTTEHLYETLINLILGFYNCKTIKQGKEEEKMIQVADDYYKPLTWWSISEAISIATTIPHSKVLGDEIQHNINKYIEASSYGKEEKKMKKVKIIP